MGASEVPCSVCFVDVGKYADTGATVVVLFDVTYRKSLTSLCELVEVSSSDVSCSVFFYALGVDCSYAKNGLC